jgi:predicted ArsR family transcriptional regulator
MATRDPEPEPVQRPPGHAGWTFLTNHAHVLLTIARDPELTLREVARRVVITERATQKIVADLEAAGYLTRTRQGRRNHYTVAHGRPFRHPVTVGHDVDELLEILASSPREHWTSEQ